MAKINVVTGRGGAGKSTFVALFAELVNAEPLLLIDLDPDGSLANMLGADLDKAGKLTVSDALSTIMAKEKNRKGKEDTPDLLRQMVENGRIIHRDKKFDIIVLGTRFAPGCYCLPDEIIKDTIGSISKDYGMILVDSPAGLEHLNRKVTPVIHDLFVVLDPSEKSVKHIDRIKFVTKGVNISYENFYLVGNYRFTDETEECLLKTEDKYLGRIANDPKIREHNLKGESLRNIPENSPSSTSVRKILREAGYALI